MDFEKEIERLKQDVKELEKKIEHLLEEKEVKFPCVLPGTNRECDWKCPAHSEHAEWKIKEGWKKFKTKVITKGHCKIIKLMEQGKVPKDLFGLIKSG